MNLVAGSNADPAHFCVGFVWGPDSTTVAGRQKDGSVVLYDVTKTPAEVRRLDGRNPSPSWLP